MTSFYASIKHPFVLILFVSTLVFANSLGGDFVRDDWPMIAENPKLKSSEFVLNAFTQGVWANSGLTDYSGSFLYRPVYLLTIYVSHSLFAENTVAFHGLSMVLHFTVSILLYLFLTRLIGQENSKAITLAVLLFAVHPVHSESVAWISGITDLLLTLFFLVSFLLYAHFIVNKRLLYYILSLVTFGMALLSKETAIVLPFILILYHSSQGRNVSWSWVGGYFVPVVLYLIVRSLALTNALSLQYFDFSHWDRFLQFVLAYTKQLLIPWPLHIYFTVPDSGVLGIAGSIFAIAVFAVFGFALVSRKVKQKNIIIFSGAWIAVTLSPSLFMAFYENGIFASRFLYLPSVGFALLVAIALIHLLSRFHGVVMISILTLLVYSAITVYTNQTWRNDETYYSRALESTPNHAGALSGLAKHYLRTQQDEKAIEFYQKSLLNGDAKTNGIALESLGLIYGTRGNIQKSIDYYQQALVLMPNRSSVYVGLGNNAFYSKEYQKASQYYQAAYQADPKNHAASYNLSLIYGILGDQENAAKYQAIAGALSVGK